MRNFSWGIMVINNMFNIKNELGIIIALDMTDINNVFDLVHKLNYIDGNFVLKVGRPLEMKYGINVISQIRDATDIPIIYDGKIADIPYISAIIAENAYNAGADAVIAHSFVGVDVIRAIVDLDMGDVITVVEISHLGWVSPNYPRSSILRLSDIGIAGIVLPATKPKMIRGTRELINDDMYIISRGVGAQGAHIGDAISEGATYEIVGRGIYEDRNPSAMAEYYYGWCRYYEHERSSKL